MVQCFLLKSAKKEEISRWRQIDEGLHGCFCATRSVQKKSFKCRHYGYIASSTMCQHISINRYLQKLRGKTQTDTQRHTQGVLISLHIQYPGYIIDKRFDTQVQRIIKNLHY